MALTKEQGDILERMIGNHPELKKEDIHALLAREDEIYLGGGDFFGKIDKEGKLVKIISEDEKLEGNGARLSAILFDGNIYDIEESSEYNNLLTFISNASGFLNVFYSPSENEFYIATRIIKKAYKAIGNNKFAETKLPEFSKEDMEDFKRWLDTYKILPDDNS
ncbi:MAG: hypothetical protein V1762_02380 [Nitrospirota bacterium]